MNLENHALVLDLVEWISRQPRAYDDVMAAWRTSCPRLTIWEDAIDNGLVSRNQDPKNGSIVQVTEKGISVLRQDGRI
jgi:CTP-dependent riboflavin kinase